MNIDNTYVINTINTYTIQCTIYIYTIQYKVAVIPTHLSQLERILRV